MMIIEYTFSDLPIDVIIYEIFEYLTFDTLIISKYFRNVKIISDNTISHIIGLKYLRISYGNIIGLEKLDIWG
jgi:hypothetical protein